MNMVYEIYIYINLCMFGIVELLDVWMHRSIETWFGLVVLTRSSIFVWVG